MLTVTVLEPVMNRSEFAEAPTIAPVTLMGDDVPAFRVRFLPWSVDREGSTLNICST